MRPWDSARIQQYIKRGTHHCGWKVNDMAAVSHVDLCSLFAQAHPQAGQMMLDTLDFDMRVVVDACRECEALTFEKVFLPQRSRFVISLIESRREQLTNDLRNVDGSLALPYV